MDEMEDDMGDFDAGGSTNSDNEKVDSILIKKILCEMKSEFNRTTAGGKKGRAKKEVEPQPDHESDNDEEETTKPTKLGNGFLPEKTDEESKGSDKDSLSFNNANSSDVVDDTEEEVIPTKVAGKPRIVLTLRTSEDDREAGINYRKRTGRIAKENVKSKSLSEFTCPEETVERRRRRSLRNRAERVEQDMGLKRSSRRMSKELTHESVLQSAIALKEKSFSSLNNSEDKPYRRSSRIIDSEQRNSSTVAKNKHRLSRSSYNENTDSSANNSPRMANKVKTNCDVDIKVELEDDAMDNGTSDDSSNIKSNTKCSPTPVRTKRRQLRQIKDPENGRSYNLMSGSRHSVDSDTSRATEGTPKIRADILSPGVIKRKVETDEESINGAKKPRQYLQSPNVEEGSEPPILSNSTFNQSMADSGGLCECQNSNGLYPSIGSFGSTQYCRAIDCFENRIIGCCNPVNVDTPLLRPSKTVPHLLMCDVHIQRLIRHNSCPSCGMFCTQGVFKRCASGHYYHKSCEMRKDKIGVCPHCGCEDNREVRISLGAHKYPVFLPMQKPPNKCPSARMSFANGNILSVEKAENEELKNLVPQVCLTLPSGRKISAEGIPSVEKEKHSYRNMYQAAKTGDAEKMIQMLGCGMNPNQVMRDGGAVCALHAAASSGHLAIVHLLIQAGANTEVLDKDQNTPLMLAALNKHNDIVKYLVKAGASVSFKGAEGMTALHIAAKEGNIEACHYLLSSANTPGSYVDTVDDGRWTPLVWAAENCHSEVVRFLLEKKADPQIRDSEMNIALHWAAFAGNMEITEDLLNYGSNINLSNAYGDTPLHISSRQGAENCVVLLLSRGARVDMMNKAGHIPRDCVTDPNSYCYIAIDLNMQLRTLMATTQSYPRILSNDISRGYETNPIQCVNMIDDDGLPTDFTYISENCLTTNITIDRRITSLTSCKCEDMCTGNGCLCAKISLRCWYDTKGKLLPDFNFEDPPMIFECNQTCSCNALTCKNRVVQRGIKVRLQLCKTRHKNWGVITLRDIPKGSYVCEYIGEIISDCEADTREDDSYLFDLDNRDGETYCIDARKYGNITRFINHSCKPNLLPVRVFIGHHDLHFPRIAFFANRDIAANEELGFDYGEKFWIIKCKSFTCKCSADTCRYSETTIQQTLEKYKENLQMEDST